MPRLTVLLSYYNLEAYLDEAIASIRTQTHRDFVLVLLDDGSTDGSPAIAARHAAADPRVRIMRSETNLGISANLNRGLAAVATELVALMDGDDIALPERLAGQLAYLDAHPEVVAVGCFPLMVTESLRPIGTPVIFHERHEDIERELLAGNGWAFLPPTAILRLAAVRVCGAFRTDLATSMDLDFFLRLGEIGRLANLPKVYQQYRLRTRSVTHAHDVERSRRHNDVLIAAYQRRGLDAAPPVVTAAAIHATPTDLHMRWSWWALAAGHVDTARHEAWLAVRGAPWSWRCWKTLLCALRGRAAVAVAPVRD